MTQSGRLAVDPRKETGHELVMVMFRSAQGLHGFSKTMFDSMHVTYLD